MYLTDRIPARAYRDPVICPACGASNFRDCHIDFALHRELVHEADALVQDGRKTEAVDLLSELYARHISNFVQPRWRCLQSGCGVKFDV